MGETALHTFRLNDLPIKEDNSLFDILNECTHDFCSDGYCSSCGMDLGPKMEFDFSYSDIHMKSTSSSGHTYYYEVNQIDYLSEQLREVVTNKLNQETCHPRESSRILAVFCGVYVEGAKIGELKPDNVVKSLKMKGRDLNKSLRVVSGTSRKTIKDNEGEVVVMPVVSISPLDCVIDICKQIDKHSDRKVKLDIHIDSIKNLISKAIKKMPSLLNERPRYVAAGFIKYYCQVNGLPTQDIGTFVDLSGPTLNQYNSKAKSLCKMYNL